MAGHRSTCVCDEGYSYGLCFRYRQPFDMMIGVGIDPTCYAGCMNEKTEKVCACEEPDRRARDNAWECCTDCGGRDDLFITPLCGRRSQVGYDILCLNVNEVDYFIWYDKSALGLACRYQYEERPLGDSCSNGQSSSNVDMGLANGIDEKCIEDCVVEKLQESDAARCAAFIENERISSYLMFQWYLKTFTACCSRCNGVIYGAMERVCALYDPSKAEYDRLWGS